MIMDNISAVLEAAGSSLEKIVKLTVYLINIEDVKFVNEVLEDRIKGGFPARSAVQVSRLPKDANVEIEAIAEI
jgi:reactive intermediate/imine deaminase